MSDPGPHGFNLSTVLATVQRFAPGRSDVTAETTIESLGLSSLERVELLMAVEEHAQTTIDEAAFAEAQRGYEIFNEKQEDCRKVVLIPGA